MDTRVKQAGEKVGFAVDFDNELASGETLFSITSVTATPAGLTIAGETIDGTTVTFSIAGGTANTIYTITATVVTSANYIRCGGGYLSVEA